MRKLGYQASRNVIALMFERVQQSARLMCGLPDYDVYVEHIKTRHPGQTIPSYEAFFRERMEARYGRSATRCC
jgi:uncharacterized short protein YbdD (DUF466 family)